MAEVTQKLKQLSDSVESEFEKRRVEKEELESKLRKAQREIQKLSKEKAELVQEKQRLEEYAKVLIVKIEKLTDQRKRSYLKLDELVNKNRRLEQELNDTKKELDDKYNQIQRLESQSHELESKKVTELMTCLEKKEKEIAELEAQLQKESSETYDLILKSSDLEKEKRRLQEKLDEKTQEVMKLTVDLEELSNQSEEKEAGYLNRIKELERNLDQGRKEFEKLRSDLEEDQNCSEEYEKLLSEKITMKRGISRLDDQSSLSHQNYVSFVKDCTGLITEMVSLFQESIGEKDNVTMPRSTMLEICERFDELIKHCVESDQEIQKMLEEVFEQINDSPAPSDISNGDLSALPNKELDEASYSKDFGYSSRCSTPRCSTSV